MIVGSIQKVDFDEAKQIVTDKKDTSFIETQIPISTKSHLKVKNLSLQSPIESLAAVSDTTLTTVSTLKLETVDLPQPIVLKENQIKSKPEGKKTKPEKKKSV